MKPTIPDLFLSIFRRFSILITSVAIRVIGSITSYGALAAPQFPKSGAVNAKGSSGNIQRTSRTLYTSNGVAAIASLLSTKVVRFSPSGIRGILDTPVDCQETSWVVPRPDAWRCIEKNRLYDPCFSTTPQGDFVICDANPIGDPRGLKATLAHSLPAPGPSSRGIQAWLMRLNDGSVCGFIPGATGVIGGERVNYGCTNGWWVVGSPQIGSVWMVKTVKREQPRLVRMMSAAEVRW